MIAADGGGEGKRGLEEGTILQQLSQFAASRLRMNELGEEVLAKLDELLGCPASCLFMYDHEPGILRPLSAHGRDADWLNLLAWLEDERLMEQLVASPFGWLAVDLAGARSPAAWDGRLRSLVLVRLAVEERLIGALALTAEGARTSAEWWALLPSLAGQVALLLRNAELYRGAQDLAVLEERRRIAREIHDGVAQNLAHLMLKAELVQKLIARDPARAAEEARALRGGIEESVQELRRCIQSLRPVHLAEFGLVAAVRSIAEDIAEQEGLELALALPRELRLGSGTEAAVFRIVQEALNNVRKHARAARVEVSLLEEAATLRAVVADDGVGFDDAAVHGEEDGHFGLAQMKERAREVGGRLCITAAPGRGTRVETWIPLGKRTSPLAVAGAERATGREA